MPPAPDVSASAVQMELGFHVTHQVVPIPGASGVFQVRTHIAPRVGGNLLHVGDVAEQLHVSVRTARRLMASGAIRSHRPGLRRRRVYQRDLDAYCRERGVGG